MVQQLKQKVNFQEKEHKEKITTIKFQKSGHLFSRLVKTEFLRQQWRKPRCNPNYTSESPCPKKDSGLGSSPGNSGSGDKGRVKIRRIDWLEIYFRSSLIPRSSLPDPPSSLERVKHNIPELEDRGHSYQKVPYWK